MSTISFIPFGPHTLVMDLKLVITEQNFDLLVHVSRDHTFDCRLQQGGCCMRQVGWIEGRKNPEQQP